MTTCYTFCIIIVWDDTRCVHYNTTTHFIKTAIELQQSAGFDAHTTANWSYDAVTQRASTNVLNPFSETINEVTMDCTETELTELISTLQRRYQNSILRRFHSFNRPNHKVTAEYPNWEELRDNWLIRKGKSVATICIPLLFDIQEKDAVIYLTLYLTLTGEFYTFRIIGCTEPIIPLIKKDVTEIIDRAYAR